MGFMTHRYLRVVALVLSLVVLVVTAAYATTVDHVVKAAIPAAALNPQQASDVLIDAAPYLAITRDATKGVAGLRYDQVTASTWVDGSVIVRVPGVNYGGSAVHFVDGKVSSVMTTANVIKDGTVSATASINGKPFYSLSLNEKSGFVQAGSWIMQGDTQVPVPVGDVHANVNWRCIGNCLTNIMGIPTWVIGLVTLVCGAACAGSGGAACIPCAQAAAIAYASELTFCIGWCRYR